MRIFLTGGSGLLGSHVAARLRARGDDVVCLQRPGSDTTFLESRGCRVVAGDIRDDAGALSTRMAGSDALIHAAALVYAAAPWPRLRAVNVEGTARVVRAAAEARVAHLVHISSVAVYGDLGETVDERTPLTAPLPTAALYARSKREAETVARSLAESAKLRLTILRPAAMYGERDRLLAPRLVRLARLPLVPLLGPGHNTLPVVYAANVAHAVERVLEGRGGKATYNLGMDHPLTQRELLRGMALALKRRPRFLPVPALLVRLGARLGRTLGVAVPGAGDLTLERIARLSLGENPYRTDRIRSELGWEPPFTHTEGLRRTASWLEAHRKTPSRETA